MAGALLLMGQRWLTTGILSARERNPVSQNDVLLSVTPGGTAVITLNRPEKHNAFNADVIAALSDMFETLRANTDEVRMVVLRGAGPSFSAGADLEWMKAAADWTHEDNEEDALGLARMLRRLHDLPQLTVALVHGAAMGGGAGLVAACDVAIAVKDTKFPLLRSAPRPDAGHHFTLRRARHRAALGARPCLRPTGEGFDGAFRPQYRSGPACRRQRGRSR